MKSPDLELAEYTKENAAIVARAISGEDLIDGHANEDGGARMAVNIASVHVPAFCKASREAGGKAYKNGYDLGKFRIGSNPPGENAPDVRKIREIVDESLPLNGASPENFYFGAVELNWTGVRFYGDLCFILKRDSVEKSTVILDRNSFDLIRPPIRTRVEEKVMTNRTTLGVELKEEASKLGGNWKDDLAPMATLKIFESLQPRKRLLTTGQISRAVLEDEDYIEVLKSDSFGADALQEARLSAPEAAQDALTGDRVRHRPTPRFEALMMRRRHQRAEEELRKLGVRVRAMTTSGRTKG